MLNVARDILRVTLPTLVVTFLLLELFFRWAIPASDPPMGWFDDESLIYRFDVSRERGMVTIGALAQQRGRWRINNSGWNSAVDYEAEKTRPRIAIVGDSYIEAQQVDVEKNFPSVLTNLAGSNYDVYSFGISGAPLSQYLHMGRHIVEKYDPDVLIFNVVHNDFQESLKAVNPSVHWLLLSGDSGSITEIPPQINYSFTQFSLPKRVLRKSALVRYLFFNLNIQTLWRKRGRFPVESHQIEQAVAYILDRMRIEFEGRHVLFVMNAPDTIYSDDVDEDVEFLHELMQSACAEAGLQLLDLTEPMKAAYAIDGLKFESPWDGHWNEYGHQFVANAVHNTLNERHMLDMQHQF